MQRIVEYSIQTRDFRKLQSLIPTKLPIERQIACGLKARLKLYTAVYAIYDDMKILTKIFSSLKKRNCKSTFRVTTNK